MEKNYYQNLNFIQVIIQNIQKINKDMKLGKNL